MTSTSSSPPTAARRHLRRGRLADETRDAILEDYIRSGRTPPGARLPSEGELCEQYGVSRVTIRAAIRSLQEAGIVNVRHGFGSTVLHGGSTIRSGLADLCSFETFARASNASIDTAEVEFTETTADEDLAREFEVPIGTPLLAVARNKLCAGEPVGRIVDQLPDGVLPFDVVRREFAGSVLDILLSYPEVGVEYADCEIVPVALDTALARQIGVPRGRPALKMFEHTRTAEGRIVNISSAWLLPEHFEFHLRRRRPPGHTR
ncbi:MAG TPA: GntR family transcriptional regulator [Solirubrobacteraceae bacterium]|jgi:DNA-binding GntR family transcriptional regulator|nr:GntR family transcriptional regulator [Solirubrobacteraceae bacterium]